VAGCTLASRSTPSGLRRRPEAPSHIRTLHEHRLLSTPAWFWRIPEPAQNRRAGPAFRSGAGLRQSCDLGESRSHGVPRCSAPGSVGPAAARPCCAPAVQRPEAARATKLQKRVSVRGRARDGAAAVPRLWSSARRGRRRPPRPPSALMISCGKMAERPGFTLRSRGRLGGDARARAAAGDAPNVLSPRVRDTGRGRLDRVGAACGVPIGPGSPEIPRGGAYSTTWGWR
jgi:hypothetical protein